MQDPEMFHKIAFSLLILVFFKFGFDFYKNRKKFNSFMKNFNSYFLFLIILFFSSFNSFNNSIVWGSIGHKVVGEIAERKLNPNVKTCS